MKLVARTRALPPWIRYGVTSIALLVALAARLALEPQLAAFPFALFIPIVLLAALLFNQAAGIYAAIAQRVSIQRLLRAARSFLGHERKRHDEDRRVHLRCGSKCCGCRQPTQGLH